MNGVDFGKKFVYLQDRYRKPDGSKWKNKEIADATDGFVSPNYISNLKKSRYHNPGYDRLRSIAEVMGFPPELWYQADLGTDERGSQALARLKETGSLADKLNFLLEVRPDPETGGRLTDDRLSELALGRVTPERVRMARSGEIDELQAAEYFSLSNVFGIDLSFWYQRQPELSQLDPRTLASLRDQEAEAVLNKFHEIQRKEDRNIIKELLDRFANRGKDETTGD